MNPFSDLWNRGARKHLAFALLAGLVLRIFFIVYPPAPDMDSALYQELGRNVVVHHIYAYASDSGLISTDVRVPGYPLFLGFLYIFFGDSQRAIVIAQALVDLGTCVLIAALAASLAPERTRRRVAIAALWLAATCPFIANYAATALTEVLATFFSAAALLVLVLALQREPAPATSARKLGSGRMWFFGGVIVGLGSLVRPETPILLAAPALVLAARWYKPVDWPRLARTGLLLAAGVLAPLAPWAARNWITLHKVQFLTARYVQMPGSYIPVGFYAWTKTWLVSYSDVENVLNRYEQEPLYIEYFPPSAFDSAEERARVQALLEDQHNDSFVFSAAADAQFAELARERTARRPFRTYLTVPFRRALTLWFTPRTELLFYEGNWWPPIRHWADYDADFAVGLLYTTLNYFYVGLALAGAFMMRKRRGVALLVVFIVTRTVFLALEHFTVEPRFVLPCVPAVLALGAMVWARSVRQKAPAV
ncbi:MAG: glycosyltransferase family 39 protein [Candidatus Acidiferrales bacterium]|jgi:4-amino-4-deoxy-L-arabinose transferase-like glycosyltransferase